MNFKEKLACQTPEQIWQEYCGFLTLSVEEYLQVQNRLMQEQMELWCASELGKRILQGARPKTVEEFRRMVPLTNYEDYADILLQRRADMLPAPPVTWIETTWEGGKRPIKVAPYTQGILDTFRRNSASVMLLASASGWGQFSMGQTVLSGLAPMPFLTGLMGLILDQEFHFTTMPPRETTTTMSFTARSKLGFKMALNSGIDYFLGMGSISYFISKQLTSAKSSSGSHKKIPLPTLLRMVKAKLKAKAAKRDLLPKDLFTLKGFICAGTDNACYKDDLEKLWGVRPMELFAGTEATLVGTETWNRRDLYFFPDACFYEFLPEEYIRRDDPYLPTMTIDQVQPDKQYELVVTVFKGGAFARYRTGDVYRCAGVGDAADHSQLPRFRYIDRVPSVIDIAGFTRITENSIQDVIDLSRLPIQEWCAAKEFEAVTGHPYLHMYVEIDPAALATQAVNEETLRKHLEIYFNYLDSDYDNLKKILEMEPLQITFLRSGTFDAYQKRFGKKPEAINPGPEKLRALTELQTEDYPQTTPVIREH